MEKCSQEIAILKLGLKEQAGSQGNPRGEVIKGIPSRAINQHGPFMKSHVLSVTGVHSVRLKTYSIETLDLNTTE